MLFLMDIEPGTRLNDKKNNQTWIVRLITEESMYLSRQENQWSENRHVSKDDIKENYILTPVSQLPGNIGFENNKDLVETINKGLEVFWGNTHYEVIVDSIGQYLVHCKFNDYYFGLFNNNQELNEKLSSFFMKAK